MPVGDADASFGAVHREQCALGRCEADIRVAASGAGPRRGSERRWRGFRQSVWRAWPVTGTSWRSRSPAVADVPPIIFQLSVVPAYPIGGTGNASARMRAQIV